MAERKTADYSILNYIKDNNYVMDTFILNNPCMAGSIPENVNTKQINAS